MPVIVMNPWKPASGTSALNDPTKFVLGTASSNVQPNFSFQDGKFYNWDQGAFYTSTTGTSWTKASSGALMPAFDYAKYGPVKNINSKRIFALPVADPNNNSSQVYVSDNEGVTWQTKNLPHNLQWRGVATNNNGVVIATGATSRGSALNRSAISIDDGNTWTDMTPRKSFYTETMQYIPRLGLFIGGYTTSLSWSFDNGLTWANKSLHLDGNGYVGKIIDTGTQLVMLCAGTGNNRKANFIRTSTDGVNWVAKTTNLVSPSSVIDIAYGDGVFVITTNTNMILTSTDAENWVQSTLPSGRTALDIAFGNGRFVFGPRGLAYVV
jgi:hypothetical protein